MATWGSTNADIEFRLRSRGRYGGQVPGRGVSGACHEVLGVLYRTARARHPLVCGSPPITTWSASRGRRVFGTRRRVKFDLAGLLVKAVMDANPWTYAIAPSRWQREGKIVVDARRAKTRFRIAPFRVRRSVRPGRQRGASVAVQSSVRLPSGHWGSRAGSDP